MKDTRLKKLTSNWNVWNLDNCKSAFIVHCTCVAVSCSGHISVSMPTRRMFQVLYVMHCVNYWYLNFNCCSSKQQLLNTGKDGVLKLKYVNFVILRGKFTFDVMGGSITIISTQLSSWIWICVTFLWWKYSFKMVKIHILCIEFSVVCMLTWVPDLCWAGVSALQLGPVLNHTLMQTTALQYRKEVNLRCSAFH